MATCKNCGKNFEPKKCTKGIYCTRACNLSFVGTRPKKATCRNCGKSFIPKRGSKGIYCTVFCSCSHLGRIVAARRKALEEKTAAIPAEKEVKKKEAAGSGNWGDLGLGPRIKLSSLRVGSWETQNL